MSRHTFKYIACRDNEIKTETSTRGCEATSTTRMQFSSRSRNGRVTSDWCPVHKTRQSNSSDFSLINENRGQPLCEAQDRCPFKKRRSNPNCTSAPLLPIGGSEGGLSVCDVRGGGRSVAGATAGPSERAEAAPHARGRAPEPPEAIQPIAASPRAGLDRGPVLPPIGAAQRARAQGGRSRPLVQASQLRGPQPTDHKLRQHRYPRGLFRISNLW